MSQEWLKKLAELSNDKELLKRAQQAQQQVRQAQPRRPAAEGPRRGLFGAAFGFFFRFLFLFAIAEAAAMFIVANVEELTNEPWGMIFHYVVWYPLTQPIFPDALYGALFDWFGLTPGDLAAFYADINAYIEEHQDVLVFLAPVGAALALTLFFLPGINAGRRKSPVRVLVYLANLAVPVLVPQMGWGVAVLWLAAFAFSFAGGGIRVSRPVQPRPPAQPARAVRPAGPARPAAPSSAVVQQRAARPARAGSHDAAVARREGSGGSWVRGR